MSVWPLQAFWVWRKRVTRNRKSSPTLDDCSTVLGDFLCSLQRCRWQCAQLCVKISVLATCDSILIYFSWLCLRASSTTVQSHNAVGMHAVKCCSLRALFSTPPPAECNNIYCFTKAILPLIHLKVCEMWLVRIWMADARRMDMIVSAMCRHFAAQLLHHFDFSFYFSFHLLTISWCSWCWHCSRSRHKRAWLFLCECDSGSCVVSISCLWL